MKILVVSDWEEWAIGIQCQGIVDSLKDKFNISHVQKSKLTKDHVSDLYYFGSYVNYKGETPPHKTVCGIVGIHERNIYDVVKTVQDCPFVTYPSTYMFDVFRHFYHDEDKMFYVPYGIDTNKFRPRKRKKNKKLIIGWAGNEKRFWKRFYPMKEMINGIEGVELRTTFKKTKLSYDEMPLWYNGLDLYVCNSIEEGFSYPILEASSCGIPVISTPVGVARDLRKGVTLVKDLDEMEAVIQTFVDSPELLKPLSEEIRVSAEWYDWSSVKCFYEKVFNKYEQIKNSGYL